MAQYKITMAILGPVVVGAGAAGAWSAYVTHERKKPPATTDFIVGSTDDMLADKLKTGDLLLFRRNWAMLQPPAALVALLTRKVFSTRYDHIGMVVKDRFGVAHVCEGTMLGVRLRRFDERVSWSKSEEIIALPLEHKPSEEARQKAERYARSLTPERRLVYLKPSHVLVMELAG
eukprot:8648-Heterococcus_DN1.PRE.1